MSITAFQDLKYPNYTLPVDTEITLATPGYAWDAVGDSFEIGMRKSGLCTRKPTNVTDHRKRKILDSVMVELDVDAIQTSLSSLYNYIKCSRQPMQVRAVTYGDHFIHLTDNGGTFGTPTGSSLAAVNFEWTCDEKDRTIKLKCGTKMHPNEWRYILANFDAPVADATGGTVSLALAANEYDRAKYLYSGIESIKIGKTGSSLVDVGLFNGPKISIKSTSAVKDHREREINAFLTFHAEFMMLQTSANDLLAAADAEIFDGTIQFGTWNDEEIKVISACSISHDLEFGDGKTGCKISVDGEIPYNIDDATPNTLDFSVTNKLTINMA